MFTEHIFAQFDGFFAIKNTIVVIKIIKLKSIHVIYKIFVRLLLTKDKKPNYQFRYNIHKLTNFFIKFIYDYYMH